MSILWLGDRHADNPALVGGKAANISRLVQAGLPIPDGFCLTTDTLEQSSYTTLHKSIGSAIAMLRDRQGEAEPTVAVRSSAIDEDGTTASFAGQHTTFLNLVGVEAILAAVLRCKESVSTQQVRTYRSKQGLSNHQPKLAVLVQQMVAADSAGVAFSANPVSGQHGEVVINANWGLGVSVVDGSMTPDTFQVHAANLTITAQHIADKQHMTILAAAGTREVAVPRMLRQVATLNVVQVIEIARLAIQLENIFGQPIDIEWAYAKGTLYLLQCRPITTL